MQCYIQPKIQTLSELGFKNNRSMYYYRMYTVRSSIIDPSDHFKMQRTVNNGTKSY